MKCALAGCTKQGVAGDAFCSRSHARLYFVGSEETGTVNAIGPSGGTTHYAGRLEPVTATMLEAAERDREARARLAAHRGGHEARRDAYKARWQWWQH